MMKRLYSTLLPALVCLSALPVLAQTAIGGGSCTSSTLNGTYEFLLNGRQVAATGAVSKVFQGVGTAAFDGLSKVTLTMTTNMVGPSQSFGVPMVYSGTYSLQSNCVGSISINSGDTGAFTVTTYSSGKAFAVIGSDATYAYNGSGNLQPATCPTTVSGVHEFNATGSALSGASVTSVLDVAGVLQFDGQGNVTANWTQVSNLVSSAVTATGTYSVGSTCLASATLTDAANNKYAVTLSFNSAAPAFVIAMSSPQAVFDGSGAAAQTAATPVACAASTLNGPYELTLSGRLAPGGITTKILASDGIATFDGLGKVTFNLTSNAVKGSQSFGVPLAYSGTYSLQSNCQGTINITSGDTATFSMVAYAINTTTQQANTFTLVGTDATYAYNGGGTVQPSACALSTLSGEWPFSATGNSLSGATNTGIVDLAGMMQFDGNGNATASWTQASNTATANVSATGTYTVTPACVGTLTLTDAANNTYKGAVTVFGALATSFELVAANPQLLFTGAGRTAFVNPGQAVVNGASYLADQAPAGSVFSIFGTNLATRVGQASNVPLPTTVLTTTVTVNGETAPLFYVDPNQINAQMPEDIKPGLATVVVKNGTSTSNAVAVMVPAVGTPGIVVYGDNRAVVTNQDGTVNSASNAAKVGDVLVAYFTGGGPVSPAGPLKAGSPSPLGLSPVAGPFTVTVGGVTATTNYMGLTPGSIGLYQANFVVPKVAAGDRKLVITISGQDSNAPLIAVK
jgi:uncharacterized protein (TIGR03437 family)